MVLFVLLSVFVITLSIGIPIAFCLGVSAFLKGIATGSSPAMLVQRISAGIQLSPLIAIPLFILAGGIMARGGVAKRIVDLAYILVGPFRGSAAPAACPGPATSTSTTRATPRSPSGPRPRGRSTGTRTSASVLASDVDGDGDLDLYVANDATPNYLFVNRGDGRFDERGFPTGVAVSGDGNEQASMGVDAADYDNDGRPDLFAAHFASDYSTLYRNLGDLLFEDVTARARIKEPGWALVKWGAARTNKGLGLLPEAIAAAIEACALKVANGEYADHFPVDVYQTGSGTSSNMNANSRHLSYPLKESK